MIGERMRPADIALGAFATTVWSGAFIATEAALRTTPPILFASLRFFVSALFIVVIARPRVDWKLLSAVALSIAIGQHAGLFVGMANGVTPGMAALLAHTQSFFTLALAWVLLGEALTPRRIFAFTLALSGLGLLMIERGTPMPVVAIALSGLALLLIERGAPMPLVAIATVLGAALSAAIGNLLLRRLGGIDPLSVAAWMSAIAAPCLLAMSVAVEGHEPLVRALTTWNPTLLIASLYAGIPSGLLAYAIWARLFGRYQAHLVAPFMLAVPVGAIALSALILGERLSWWRLGAAVAIVVGLALNMLPQRRTR
jgi:O-acetylserine/cysteine efflux transporter